MDITNGKIKNLKNKNQVEVIEERDNFKEKMHLTQPSGLYKHPKENDPCFIFSKDGEPIRFAYVYQQNLNINTEEGDIVLNDYKNYIQLKFEKGIIYIKAENKIEIEGKVEFKDDVRFLSEVKFNKNVEILGNLEVKGSLTNKETQVSVKGHVHTVSLNVVLSAVTGSTGGDV